MKAGDVVSVEVHRGPSESVMRLKVDGRPAKEARGLPNMEELYLVVSIFNDQQSYTLLSLSWVLDIYFNAIPVFWLQNRVSCFRFSISFFWINDDK